MLSFRRKKETSKNVADKTFKTSFSDILRDMHFLCATENSPQEAVGKD